MFELSSPHILTAVFLLFNDNGECCNVNVNLALTLNVTCLAPELRNSNLRRGLVSNSEIETPAQRQVRKWWEKKTLVLLIKPRP